MNGLLIAIASLGSLEPRNFASRGPDLLLTWGEAHSRLTWLRFDIHIQRGVTRVDLVCRQQGKES